ncbi:MAG: hypothetical protein H7Z75_06930 [Ferruginibacter sp.]|nr:hypothetical protein [Cytophagales bacterium]
MTPQQLKKELLKHDRQFLTELIVAAISRKREFKTAILEKLNEKISAQGAVPDANGDEPKTKLNDELLTSYWKELKKIVSKSNQYGGCPPKEENKAYRLFDKVTTLLDKEVFSDDLRTGILEEATVEHQTGNSGFDDALMDLLNSLCVYRSDWEYLIDYLENKRSGFGSYYQELARQIRKDKLRDDEGFLQSARAGLQYGTNYHELGMFYAEKNDLVQAVATMEQGLVKGEGRLDDLFDYLFDYHARQKNDGAVDRLLQTAHNRQTYVAGMADKAFGYYRDTHYEKAKSALLDKFRHVSELSTTTYLDLYRKAEAFLTEGDWRTEEPGWLAFVAQHRPLEHLELLLYKGEKKAVLDRLLSGNVRDEWWDKGRLDKIGRRIQEEFPEEMIAHYWQKATGLIDLAGRENYAKAASYLKEVQHLYTHSLRQPDVFAARIRDLGNLHPKKRALWDELAGLV